MKVIPPALATWMLKHLVPGEGNEALEGDLLEEFQRRRSASWYWRQVLAAILGFSNLSRVAWLTFWTAIFAGLWVGGLYKITSLTAHLSIQTTFGNWLNRAPYGKAIWVAEGIVFYLAGPLSVYLALARKLSLRSLAVGMGAGVFTVIALPFFLPHLETPLSYLFGYALAKHWNVTLWLRWYEVLEGSQAPVGFVPLFAGMWAASFCKSGMGRPQSAGGPPHESK